MLKRFKRFICLLIVCSMCLSSLNALAAASYVDVNDNFYDTNPIADWANKSTSSNASSERPIGESSAGVPPIPDGLPVANQTITPQVINTNIYIQEGQVIATCRISGEINNILSNYYVILNANRNGKSQDFYLSCYNDDASKNLLDFAGWFPLEEFLSGEKYEFIITLRSISNNVIADRGNSTNLLIPVRQELPIPSKYYNELRASTTQVTVSVGSKIRWRDYVTFTACYSDGTTKDATYLVGHSTKDNAIATAPIEEAYIYGHKVGTTTVYFGWTDDELCTYQQAEVIVNVVEAPKPVITPSPSATNNNGNSTSSHVLKNSNIIEIKQLMKTIMTRMGVSFSSNFDFSSDNKDSAYYIYLSVILGKGQNGYGITYINEYSSDEYVLQVLKRIESKEIVKYRYLAGSEEQIKNEVRAGKDDNEIARAYQFVSMYKNYLNTRANEITNTRVGANRANLTIAQLQQILDNIDNNYNKELCYIQYLMFQNTVFQNADYNTVIVPLYNGVVNSQPIDSNTLDKIVKSIKAQDVFINDYFNVATRENIKNTITFIIDFIPAVGDGKGIIEGVIGKDYVTGEPLSWFERGLSILCLAEIRDIGKLGKVSEKIKHFYKGIDETTAFGRLKSFSESAVKKVDNVNDICKNGNATSKYLGKSYSGIRNSALDFTDKNGSTLLGHYTQHKEDFTGLNNVEEYLKGARSFLEKQPTLSTRSFVSNDGWYYRYDIATNEFGIINKYGGISTYFKPKNLIGYWLEQIDKYAPK